MQSPEYPDLPWMPPRSWSDANRTAVQLVVIHVTDGAARASAAKDGAAYDQRRTDGVSTHYFHDCDSTIQCVRTADQAHAARTQGNRRGIQHELCTTANKADWADTYHQAMLRVAARQAARDAKKWDIPVRHLTVAEVADGVKGFCGHVDITHAFPQDHGTHVDPGPKFPWSQFLDLVRAEMEDDEMPTADEIADACVKKFRNTREVLSDTERGLFATATAAAVDGRLAARFAALAAKDVVDEQALAAALVPAIVAALPAGAGVTAEQLQAAIVAALRELAAPAA
jgi:N-acetyl-anhydromuramyl-L-alanine amidase AmpD